MQQTTLFSVNSRTNNSAHNKRNLDTNPNTEFSYNDILRDEVSKMSKQRKRSSVNNQLAQSSANARPVLNSAPQISLLPNYIANLSLGSTQNQVIKGDVNRDGIVDRNDVDALERHIVGLNDDVDIESSDMNGDGKISIIDVAKLELHVQETTKSQEKTQILKGDANGDGEVSIADAQRVLNYARGKINLNELYRDNADVNNDGIVDEKDAEGITNILKYGTVTNPNEQQNIPVTPIVGNQPEEQQNIPIITCALIGLKDTFFTQKN